MKLSYDIENKEIRVVDTDDIERQGHVDEVCPESDSIDGKRGIFLTTPKEQIYLSESDIKSLEIIA